MSLSDINSSSKQATVLLIATVSDKFDHENQQHQRHAA